MSARSQQFRRGGQRAARQVVSLAEMKAYQSRVRNELNGQVLRPSADPKSVVDQPWYSLVEVFESTEGTGGENFLTMQGLIQAVSDTMSIPTTSLHVRVEEVRVWDISGAGLRVDFYNLTRDTAGAFTRTVSDEPGRNHWARVGYRWSKADRNAVFREGSSTRIVAQEAAPGQQVVVHVHLLWRSRTDTEKRRRPALECRPYETQV